MRPGDQGGYRADGGSEHRRHHVGVDAGVARAARGLQVDVGRRLAADGRGVRAPAVGDVLVHRSGVCRDLLHRILCPRAHGSHGGLGAEVRCRPHIRLRHAPHEHYRSDGHLAILCGAGVERSGRSDILFERAAVIEDIAHVQDREAPPRGQHVRRGGAEKRGAIGDLAFLQCDHHCHLRLFDVLRGRPPLLRRPRVHSARRRKRDSAVLLWRLCPEGPDAVVRRGDPLPLHPLRDVVGVHHDDHSGLWRHVADDHRGQGHRSVVLLLRHHLPRFAHQCAWRKL
mmetsp:Transcript_91707/g.264494  ORF Transcript_91707/g.264494 Transcript_91707/m.264494 type:complete len:284 (-) Transcript_91707:1458-2309(-)